MRTHKRGHDSALDSPLVHKSYSIKYILLLYSNPCLMLPLCLVLKLSDILWVVPVRPRELLGAPPREGTTVEVPAGRRSSISGYADSEKSPSTGSPQGGEGLADPAVLCVLEIAGQDASLVLQLLYEDNTGVCQKCEPHLRTSSFQSVHNHTLCFDFL